LINTVTD